MDPNECSNIQDYGKVMSKNHKKISLHIKNCVDICDIQDNINDKNENAQNNKKNGHFVDKKEIARRRWGLLAKALKSPISSQPASPTDEVSVRRFSTFSLLTPEPIEDLKQPEENSTENKKYDEQKNNWYRYSTVINDKKYFIEINHLTRSFTAHDLMGFNNTGNVCVWPSEESLSYYILNNLSLFINTKVLELGAGMSALAGLMVAKYGQPKLVHLTDGNKLAVENIKKSLSKNLFQCDVNCSILQWGKSNIFQKFDVILSADCLFFDEARMDLIDTIHDFLTDRGVALVMAPRRGSTLDIFINCAELKGFRCDKLILYDNNVWKRHLECLQNLDEYDEDIHYPILLKLTKFTRQ